MDVTRTFEERLTIFSEHLNDCLSRYRIGDLNKCGLVFFPLLNRKHFLCLVFSLETGHIFVLDNLVNGDAAKYYYENIHENLRDRFSEYLATKRHPMMKTIRRFVPCRLRLSWQTSINGTDCGVFLMCHMEMFKGVNNFDAGLRPENNRQQAHVNNRT